MLQQYVNCEFPDVQAGFRKGRGTRKQIAMAKKSGSQNHRPRTPALIGNTDKCFYISLLESKLMKILKDLSPKFSFSFNSYLLDTYYILGTV